MVTRWSEASAGGVAGVLQRPETLRVGAHLDRELALAVHVVETLELPDQLLVRDVALGEGDGVLGLGGQFGELAQRDGGLDHAVGVEVRGSAELPDDVGERQDHRGGHDPTVCTAVAEHVHEGLDALLVGLRVAEDALEHVLHGDQRFSFAHVDLCAGCREGAEATLDGADVLEHDVEHEVMRALDRVVGEAESQLHEQQADGAALAQGVVEEPERDQLVDSETILVLLAVQQRFHLRVAGGAAVLLTHETPLSSPAGCQQHGFRVDNPSHVDE